MLSLKSPNDFPMTFLWFSNLGRDHHPWNGRHVRVLSVQEGRANSTLEHRALMEPSPLSASGIATAVVLDPEGMVTVRKVIGAGSLSAAHAAIAGIEIERASVILTGEIGHWQTVPFDPAFLAQA